MSCVILLSWVTWIRTGRFPGIHENEHLHWEDAMARKHVRSCRTMGGRSPKTGQPVGERHRWSGGAWGKGHCEFCFSTLDQVLDQVLVDAPRKASTQTVEQTTAVAREAMPWPFPVTVR